MPTNIRIQLVDADVGGGCVNARIAAALEEVRQVEGLECLTCRRPGSWQIHHVVPKDLAARKAREEGERHSELLAQLCPMCHTGPNGVHASEEARQRLFARKVQVYGREGMDMALAAVNAHLKLKLTWAGMGYE